MSPIRLTRGQYSVSGPGSADERKAAYTFAGMRCVRLLAAGGLASLALAAPAAAVTTAPGVSVKLHEGNVIAVGASTTRQQHSCQSNRIKVGRKFAPVACEQPPKANLASPELSKAVATAIATIG
jgi:hypothetical protein